MKLLTVIVSYNFSFYLRNAVNSFLEYFKEGDLLIVDNNSNDKKVLEFLEHISSNKRVKMIYRQENSRLTKVGSLYEANNSAIEYGLENGYDLFQFIQNDMQCMYSPQGITQRIAKILNNHKEISMVMPIFPKRVMAASFNKRYTRRDDIGTFESLDYGSADIGFMSADFIKKHSFRFQNSEGYLSKAMYDKGFCMHALQEPFWAFVPWVAVCRASGIIGKEYPPVNKFYYKPFSGEQVQQLFDKARRSVVFTEDFCAPWGWKCLWPYWFTEWSFEYFKLIRENKYTLKTVGVDCGRTKGHFLPDTSHWVYLFLRECKCLSRRFFEVIQHILKKIFFVSSNREGVL